MISKSSPRSTAKSGSILQSRKSTAASPLGSAASGNSGTGSLPNINGLEYPNVVKFEKWYFFIYYNSENISLATDPKMSFVML